MALAKAQGAVELARESQPSELEQVGTLAAVYPAVWGVAQLLTGALSDRLGRKWLIASAILTGISGTLVAVRMRETHG